MEQAKKSDKIAPDYALISFNHGKKTGFGACAPGLGFCEWTANDIS